MILMLVELFIRFEREQIILVPFGHLSFFFFFSLSKTKDIPRSINSTGLGIYQIAG